MVSGFGFVEVLSLVTGHIGPGASTIVEVVVVEATEADGVALASSPLTVKGTAPALTEPLAEPEGEVDSPICSAGMLTMTACIGLPVPKPERETQMAELPSSERVEHRESVRCTSF